MVFDFSGQHALVTGGTKGIGKATALLFAELGAEVTATYAHDESAASALRDELGSLAGEHAVEKCDLADYDALRELVTEMDRDDRLPEILVCNAAYQRKAALTETDVALLEQTFRANLFGHFVLAREVCDRLRAKGRPGVVVIHSSNQSELVFETGFAYALTKASLNHLVRHLALAYAPDGIRVNGVLLGWFDTEGERAFYSSEQIAEQSRGIPAGRAGTPDEAAKLAVFLASPHASYATGSLIRLDGGFTLAPDLST